MTEAIQKALRKGTRVTITSGSQKGKTGHIAEVYGGGEYGVAIDGRSDLMQFSKDDLQEAKSVSKSEERYEVGQSTDGKWYMFHEPSGNNVEGPFDSEQEAIRVAKPLARQWRKPLYDSRGNQVKSLLSYVGKSDTGGSVFAVSKGTGDEAAAKAKWDAANEDKREEYIYDAGGSEDAAGFARHSWQNLPRNVKSELLREWGKW